MKCGSKKVRAVKPFEYRMNSNFKMAVYKEWKMQKGLVVSDRPYEKWYKSLSFHLDIPSFLENKKEARLRFVEAASLMFDTFPDYVFYEVILFVWDCWPRYWGVTEMWFRKHRVRTAIFTSSQTAEHFKSVFPELNILHCPEAIDTDKYKVGNPLKDRNIDFLEYGRCSLVVDSASLEPSIKVLSSNNEQGVLSTREKLIDALSDSKITIALTRQDNQPDIAEGVDTLTQRYWECMLSGVIMLGRAPQELIDIIGYDPVIHIDYLNVNEQICDMLRHIENYQELVDRNRKVALEMGDWKGRMKDVMVWLQQQGYEI